MSCSIILAAQLRKCLKVLAIGSNQQGFNTSVRKVEIDVTVACVEKEEPQEQDAMFDIAGQVEAVVKTIQIC